MEKAVEIESPHHALDVLARFNSFRKDNKFCDFVIKSGEEVLPVHKCVVAASSEYFDAMLSHDTKESNEGVVEIKQSHSQSIKKCIEFMYTGKATVSDEMQEEFLHTAHMLRLHRLYNGIAMSLEENLDSESFFQTRRIANRYDCDKLQEVCNEFALNNFEAIVEKDAFKTLEADYLSFLLSSDCMKDNDGLKCKAVMIWINNDSNRVSSLLDLMKGINFLNVPLSYRMYILSNEERVVTDVECVKHILKSLISTQETTPCDFSLHGDFGIVIFDTSSKMLQHFSTKDKSWTPMQALTSNMSEHCTAVVVDDYIYAIVWDQSMHRIKFRDGTAHWEKMASPRIVSGVATVHEGLIYVSDGSNYNTGIERYNAIQNNWSLLPAKKLSTYGSSLAPSSGNLYVIGGYCNSGAAVNDVECYKLSTSEWENVMSMNISRYFASATSVCSQVYVFGGYNSSGNYESSMEIYHPVSNVWHIVSLANFSRIHFSSWAHAGKIYLVGGNTSGKKTIDEFDPKTKILTRIVELDNKSINYYSSVAVFI